MNFCLVDVKAITPARPPRGSELENADRLADAILECGGLAIPLILMQTGPEAYTLVSGHAGYYAAKKAREKDPRKGEMVNAFVIPPENEDAVNRQLEILATNSHTSAQSTTNIEEAMDVCDFCNSPITTETTIIGTDEEEVTTYMVCEECVKKYSIGTTNGTPIFNEETQPADIEARILSEITPEDAHALFKFMLKLPAAKQIDSSLTWEESHKLSRKMNVIRAFLTFRADEKK